MIRTIDNPVREGDRHIFSKTKNEPVPRKFVKTAASRGAESDQHRALGSTSVTHVSDPRSPNHRTGFSLVELIGACLLLGILFSMTIPMFVVVARERHSTQQRQFALQHAANLLERATEKDWAELIPGELAVPDADADLMSVLPGLERHLVVKSVDGQLPARQIIASIRWQTTAGVPSPPVQVSAWVYPKGEVP
jgi:hypothetical protein